MREAISRGLLHEDTDRYAEFRALYRNDPVGFAENCVLWRDGGLADYQREALAKLVRHYRVSLRAPHGVGKSAVSAITGRTACSVWVVSFKTDSSPLTTVVSLSPSLAAARLATICSL